MVPRDARACTWDEHGPDMKRARTMLAEPTDGYAYRLGDEDIADMNAWQEDYASGREINRWVWDDECESGRGGWRQPSRQEYRQAGNARKSNRARGGGAKAEWFKQYTKLQWQNPRMTKNDIIAEIGPCLANQTVLKSGKGK